MKRIKGSLTTGEIVRFAKKMRKPYDRRAFYCSVLSAVEGMGLPVDWYKDWPEEWFEKVHEPCPRCGEGCIGEANMKEERAGIKIQCNTCGICTSPHTTVKQAWDDWDRDWGRSDVG